MNDSEFKNSKVSYLKMLEYVNVYSGANNCCLSVTREKESLKERYFKEFFDRNWKVKKDFEKDNVDKIRHCYAEEIFKEDEI